MVVSAGRKLTQCANAMIFFLIPVYLQGLQEDILKT